MKKYTEKIIYIVVILILFSATIGCSLNSEQRADEYVIAVDDYSIIKEKGDCYIAFDNISLYENNNQSVPATIRFDSVKEFKTSIIQGKLSVCIGAQYIIPTGSFVSAWSNLITVTVLS